MSGYIVRVRGGGGYVSREYLCLEHGVFDELVERNHAAQRMPHACPICGAASEPAMSAPHGRVKLGEVMRGKVEAAPSPYALDTQPLADGMPLSEFKARRRKLWDDKRRADWKAKIG